jgi:hypothetical protein
MVVGTQGGNAMNRMKSMLLVSAVACSGATYAASGPSHVFRCTDADGHVVFSDTSCGSTSEKVEVVQSSGGLSAVGGNGLSAAERSTLNAIDAHDAQVAAQRAQGGGGSAAPSAPAPAASPSPPVSHGY